MIEWWTNDIGVSFSIHDRHSWRLFFRAGRRLGTRRNQIDSRASCPRRADINPFFYSRHLPLIPYSACDVKVLVVVIESDYESPVLLPPPSCPLIISSFAALKITRRPGWESGPTPPSIHALRKSRPQNAQMQRYQLLHPYTNRDESTHVDAGGGCSPTGVPTSSFASTKPGSGLLSLSPS